MGRGSSKVTGATGGGIAANRRFESLPESEIRPLAPTKRAREVFEREYSEARRAADYFIERGNYNEGNALGTLYANDDEPVISERAMGGIQALINSEWDGLRVDEELGVSSAESIERRRYALTLLQNTLNRSYNFSYGEFKKR